MVYKGGESALVGVSGFCPSIAVMGYAALYPGDEELLIAAPEYNGV
jgi:hypothetical protein